MAFPVPVYTNPKSPRQHYVQIPYQTLAKSDIKYRMYR